MLETEKDKHGMELRTRRGRPSKDEDRDLKSDLLDAAVELFSEKGFSEVSIRDVTDRAGGSVGMVRHYFGSKSDLIDATNMHVVNELQAVFDALGSNLDTNDGEPMLERLYQRTVELLAPRRSLLFYLRRLVSDDPTAAHKVFRAYFQMLQGHFNRLEAAGALAPDANKVWLTFQLMFIQLGPVFLFEQIEAIVGRSPYDADMMEERGREAMRLLKAAVKPAP